MPRDEIDINNYVMDKIRSGEIKMRSRLWFIFGSLAVILGLVGSAILMVFFVSLMSFSLRTHGPMGSYRLQEILSSFPWWAPVLALVGLGLGVWLLKKYDFSYRRNLFLIVMGLLLALILAGVTIDYLGLDDIWLKHGPMRQYWQQSATGTGRHGQGQGQGKMMRNNND